MNRVLPLLTAIFFIPVLALAVEGDSGNNELLLFQEMMVEVASQEAEPLCESPVITTVITADQIERMGARTLNEVLLTVPGFSKIQDHNEYYSAARGIYASSQQKILVLRDGHRLNSRCYSEANFGPAISLANIKRIEVMRGPGSTIYGDVALTAVVNIITKKGKDMQGGSVNVGVGNFGQKKVDVLSGNRLDDSHQISFYGSLFQSDGEERAVDASADYSPVPADGTVVIDRFKSSQPAYDLGLNYEAGDWEFAYSHRYDHYTMPRGGGGAYGQLIDLEAFRSFEGEGIGSSSEFEHFDLKYKPKVNDIQLEVRPYYDTFVFRDSEPQRRAGEPGALADVAKGYFMKWMERSYGIQAYASVPYELPSGLGQGKILAGAQAEEMHLYDSWDIHTPDPTHAAYWIGTPQILKTGREQSYGIYAQLKHYFTSQVILNGGLRYDYRHRLSGGDVDALSPRVALLWLPLDALHLRLNYGRSFVDSPYWYRYNQSTGSGYAGAETLKPERLENAQLTLTHHASKYISHNVNLFYNNFTDVVYRSTSYTNAGRVISHGLEYEFNWQLLDSLDLRANYTYQLTDDSVFGMKVADGMLENVPRNMANLIVDAAPFTSLENFSWAKNIWLHLHLQGIGEQFSIWGKSGNYAGRDLNYTVPAVLLTNVGIHWKHFVAEPLTLKLNVYNLTDQRYLQGGSVNLPYEQPGRWFLAQMQYAW